MKNSPKLEQLYKMLGGKNYENDHEKYLWNKAFKYLKPLKYVPGLQLICIVNSLSMNATHENSDIDLLIVAKTGRLWSVRLITSLYFAVLGQRKTAKKHSGKFCLSFYADDSGLDFGDFALEDDPYLSLWLYHTKPIINYNSTYEKLRKINTELAPEILDGTYSKLLVSRDKKTKNGFIGNKIEAVIKKYFLKKTLRSYEKAGKPYGIEINDHLLKFHKEDKRKMWAEKLKNL